MGSTSKLPHMDAAYDVGNGFVPENELMRAIMLRAIEDLQQGGLFAEDARAFFDDEDDDEEYVFSFPTICRALGLDPDKTRAAIYNRTKRISTRRRTV